MSDSTPDQPNETEKKTGSSSRLQRTPDTPEAPKVADSTDSPQVSETPEASEVSKASQAAEPSADAKAVAGDQGANAAQVAGAHEDLTPAAQDTDLSDNAGRSTEAPTEAPAEAPTVEAPAVTGQAAPEADPAADPAPDSPAAAEAGARKTNKIAPIVAGGLVLILAAGIGGYFLGQNSGHKQQIAQDAASQVGAVRMLHEPNDMHRRLDGDPLAIGEKDAPVVISYFSDLECPVCAKFDTDVEPKIIEDYVNAGKVRLEWNDMPIVNESSALGVQAGRAAAAQGKFWEFKNAVYHGEGASGHPKNDIDKYVAFAKDAGVSDLDRFRKEIEDGTYASVATNALIYGSAFGISGTPTFIINGTFLPNLPDYDTFKDLIEQGLRGETPKLPEAPAAKDKAADKAADKPAEKPADKPAGEQHEAPAPAADAPAPAEQQ